MQIVCTGGFHSGSVTDSEALVEADHTVPAGTRGVDIEEDRLLGVLKLQVEQLGNDQLGDIHAHLALGVVIGEQGQAQVNDPFLQQQRGQVRRWGAKAGST